MTLSNRSRISSPRCHLPAAPVQLAPFLELFDEGDLILRQGPVELFGIRLMRVAARDQARPRRAAGGGGEKGALEAHPEAASRWRLGVMIDSWPKGERSVAPRIVGEDEDEVREGLEFLETAEFLRVRWWRLLVFVLVLAPLRHGGRGREERQENEEQDKSRNGMAE